MLGDQETFMNSIVLLIISRTLKSIETKNNFKINFMAKSYVKRPLKYYNVKFLFICKAKYELQMKMQFLI